MGYNLAYICISKNPDFVYLYSYIPTPSCWVVFVMVTVYPMAMLVGNVGLAPPSEER